MKEGKLIILLWERERGGFALIPYLHNKPLNGRIIIRPYKNPPRSPFEKGEAGSPRCVLWPAISTKTNIQGFLSLFTQYLIKEPNSRAVTCHSTPNQPTIFALGIVFAIAGFYRLLPATPPETLLIGRLSWVWDPSYSGRPMPFGRFPA